MLRWMRWCAHQAHLLSHSDPAYAACHSQGQAAFVCRICLLCTCKTTLQLSDILSWDTISLPMFDLHDRLLARHAKLLTARK